MREDFNGQSRHVIDAAVGLRGVSVMISAAGLFLRSRDATDLSDLGNILTQRNTWKGGHTVDFIINFIRLNI